MSVHTTSVGQILVLDDICVSTTGLLFSHICMLVNHTKVVASARDYVALREIGSYNIGVLAYAHVNRSGIFTRHEIELTLEQIY